MNQGALLAEIVRIILRHLRPRRIYLHGSRATGEASDVSDIDIAYEAPSSEDHARIVAEIAKLPTLLKIDVRNLTDCEERFANRVRATGKVLYSGTKRLRFEDAVENFKMGFTLFCEALDRKPLFYEAGFNDVYPDLVAKRFSFVFEMAWKSLRRYFDYVGMECPTPRDCFREGYAQGLLDSRDVWLDMIEHRELSAGEYEFLETREIEARSEEYRAALGGLLGTLAEKLKADDAGWMPRGLPLMQGP
jgi:nucleotidyltransferase substrate binding protein (TIGR01987 family)